MLKPMAKKSITLPSPHSCFEEWHLQSQMKNSASNGAALRIQHRYRKYRERVRSILKKSDKAAETRDAVVEKANGTSKPSGMDKIAMSSSMALGVVLKSQKESKEQETKAYRAGIKCSLSEYSAGKKKRVPWDAKSAKSDAELPDWLFSLIVAHETVENDCMHLASDSDNIIRATSVTKEGNAVGSTLRDCSDASDLTVESQKFVNVMSHSWLLSSVAERCNREAAMEGKRSLWSLVDLRRLVMDLVFVLRSGSSGNLHGRPPSSLEAHKRNLVRKMTTRENICSVEGPPREQAIEHILHKLQSDMVMPAVSCLGWLLTKAWRLLFQGLHVDVESLHRLRSVLEARDPNVSVVFAPTHKTHLDYLIVSYLCYAYNIPLPRIAAGNNLDLPVVGSFLRANGSFFIRRSFRDDVLYKDVLRGYVHELMDDGNPIEVFVEAGRSRHGRVCKPRLGFLSMFSDWAQSGTGAEDSKRDVLLVPISLDYDKVLEVEDYTSQLLGKPKEKESIGGLLRSIAKLFFLRCGHSYVRFGEPLSIREHSNLHETAQELACRMQKCGTISSTALVCAVLLWKRNYVTESMLQVRVRWLVTELQKRQATLAPLEEELMVEHAMEILDVGKSETGVVLSQLGRPEKALEYSFYRNHLLHVFLPEVAVVGAFDALSCQRRGVIHLDEVVEEASFLWRYLSHICRHDAIEVKDEVLRCIVQHPSLCVDPLQREQVLIKRKSWRVSKSNSFLLSLLHPFVDSLWLVTLTLWLIVDKTGVSLTDRLFVKQAQKLGKLLLGEAKLLHAEALCSESFKQALDFLKEMDLIRVVRGSDGSSHVVEFQREHKTGADVVRLCVRVNAHRKRLARLWGGEEVAASNLTKMQVQELLS